METKLHNQMPQTSDRRDLQQLSVESELRRRLQISVNHAGGIFAMTDVNVNTSPLALSVNSSVSSAINVNAGSVLFSNGEILDVSSNDLVGVSLPNTQENIIYLEYGEVDSGDAIVHPNYAIASKPLLVKATPLEMLRIVTLSEYNALSNDIKASIVVIGVATFSDSVLTVDNGRDTYSFSRPWASVKDLEHRSKLGTGLVTDTNPHGMSANDYTLGNLGIFQVSGGFSPVVISPPESNATFSGIECTETVLGGNFVSDPLGVVTGVAGSFYTLLSGWPEKLLSVNTVTSSAPTAAWILKGTQILAVRDLDTFATATDLVVIYSCVKAGSLPDNLAGLTQLTLQDPINNELIISGGIAHTKLAEPNVFFTDVGLTPMVFDILLDGAGVAYKSPQVIWCCANIADAGGSISLLDIQPLAQSKIRVSISDYNPSMTSFKATILGTDKLGVSISEQVVISGPLSANVRSNTPAEYLKVITLAEFSSVTSLQIDEALDMGAGAKVTVFAELNNSAASPINNHCLLGSVHWDGAVIGNNFGTNPAGALDLRQISRGGALSEGTKISLLSSVPVPTGFNITPSTVNSLTILEDFGYPDYLDNQAPTYITGSNFTDQRILGMRGVYQSRKIPLPAQPISNVNLRLLPTENGLRHNTRFSVSVIMTVYTSEGFYTTAGSLDGLNAAPPFDISWVATPNILGDVYAVHLSVAMGNTRETPFFGGWMLNLS